MLITEIFNRRQFLSFNRLLTQGFLILNRIVYIISMLAILSCNRDVNNVRIFGKVNFENSEMTPLNSGLVFKCWSYGKTPDESYSSLEVKSVVISHDYSYNVHFKKGSFVEIYLEYGGKLVPICNHYIVKSENSLCLTVEAPSEDSVALTHDN